MRVFGIFSFVTALLFAYTAPVLQVNDEYEMNIKKIIETNGEAYIVFHASWCGACHHLKPHYQEFAESLAESDPSVLVLAIDNDKAPKMVARFQIAYLPSFFHIRNGMVRNISDQRGNLGEYVSQKKWETIKPLNHIFTPYSFLGNTLAMIGTFGFKIIELAHNVSKKTKIPINLVLGGSIALVFIIFYSFMFAAMNNQSAKDQEDSEDDEPDAHFKKD